MSIFGAQKNMTPAILQAREKLKKGGKLVILGDGAFPEETTGRDHVKIIFERSPQHVITAISEMPDEFGVPHVKELHEPDLQNLSFKEIIQHARFTNQNTSDSAPTLKVLKGFASQELSNYHTKGSLNEMLNKYLYEHCNLLFSLTGQMVSGLERASKENDFKKARKHIEWYRKAKALIAKKDSIKTDITDLYINPMKALESNPLYNDFAELIALLSPLYNEHNLNEPIPETFDELIDKISKHYEKFLHSELAITVQKIEVIFSINDLYTSEGFYQLMTGKALWTLLSTLGRLQCRIQLSDNIHFPAAYSTIPGENVVFVGSQRKVFNFLSKSKVTTIYTGTKAEQIVNIIDAPFEDELVEASSSSIPSFAPELAHTLGYDFNRIVFSIIEENRRIFGLVLDQQSQTLYGSHEFNPLIEFIQARESEYFHNGESIIDLSSIFNELERTNRDFAKARHQPGRLSLQWLGLLLVPTPTRLDNPLNELLQRVSNTAEHSEKEDKLLKKYLSYQFLNPTKLTGFYNNIDNFATALSSAIPRFAVLFSQTVDIKRKQKLHAQFTNEISKFISENGLPFRSRVPSISACVLESIRPNKIVSCKLLPFTISDNNGNFDETVKIDFDNNTFRAFVDAYKQAESKEEITNLKAQFVEVLLDTSVNHVINQFTIEKGYNTRAQRVAMRVVDAVERLILEEYQPNFSRSHSWTPYRSANMAQSASKPVADGRSDPQPNPCGQLLELFARLKI